MVCGKMALANYHIPLITDELKQKIRKRDSYICQNCGITEKIHKIKYGRILTVHHIDYNKQNCKESNLITVCLSCNLKANGNRDYWFAYYKYLIENCFL